MSSASADTRGGGPTRRSPLPPHRIGHRMSGPGGWCPQALQHLWRDVYTQWFPSNPYGSRPGPEILSVRLAGDGARADAELWIPVERSAA